MKTFEQPLSAKEETEYLEIMNGEDLEAAHRARQILIERNLRLVAHVSKKYMGCGEDMEDLISIGTIGLIKAVNTFKAEKGSRLATYAAKCIDNELLMMFRARRKVTREVSLYEPIGTDKEGNEINLIDVCEQEQRDIVDDMDMMAKLGCLSRRLVTPGIKHRGAKMDRHLGGPEHRPRHLAAEHVQILLAELFQILWRHNLLMKGIAGHTHQQSCISAEGEAGVKALVKRDVDGTQVLPQRLVPLE